MPFSLPIHPKLWDACRAYVRQLGFPELAESRQEELRAAVHEALERLTAETSEPYQPVTWQTVFVIREITKILADSTFQQEVQAAWGGDAQAAIGTLAQPRIAELKDLMIMPDPEKQGDRQVDEEAFLDPRKWIPSPHPAQTPEEHLICLHIVSEYVKALEEGLARADMTIVEGLQRAYRRERRR